MLFYPGAANTCERHAMEEAIRRPMEAKLIGRTSENGMGFHIYVHHSARRIVSAARKRAARKP